MNAILPIASYTNGVGFLIQFAYRPKGTAFAGEVCKTNRSLVRTESCWKSRRTVLLHCLQPSHKLQHGTYVLRGVAWASARNGANWQRGKPRVREKVVQLKLD